MLGCCQVIAAWLLGCCYTVARAFWMDSMLFTHWHKSLVQYIKNLKSII